MQYKKKPFSFPSLADLLLDRGLIASKSELKSVLSRISYYRLSGYWYPFRLLPGNEFKEGTNLEIVLHYYNFDNALRILVFKALETIETKLKNQIMHHHVHRYGPNGYRDRKNLPFMDNREHSDFLEKLRSKYSSSRAKFIQHFKDKYGNENDFPLWMACELMSFNSIVRLFRGMEFGMQQAIASDYRIADIVLSSWLLSLNSVRNICAHHNRLWNRTIGLSPMIPSPSFLVMI